MPTSNCLRLPSFIEFSLCDPRDLFSGELGYFSVPFAYGTLHLLFSFLGFRAVEAIKKVLSILSQKYVFAIDSSGSWWTYINAMMATHADALNTCVARFTFMLLKAF